MSIGAKEGKLGYLAYQRAVRVSEAVRAAQRYHPCAFPEVPPRDTPLLAELAAAQDAEGVGVLCEEGGESAAASARLLAIAKAKEVEAILE